MTTTWLDTLLSESTTSPVRNGSYGNKVFLVFRDYGTYHIRYSGSVGTGVKPSPDTLSEVDFIKFLGDDLIANKMLLTKQGKDLIIEFEGIQDVKVVLLKFDLEDLDNLSKATKGAVNIGNILFDGDNNFQDSFDVINADANPEKTFRPNTVTFLNDLDNNVSGYDDSNDIINGQAGNDTLTGLGGDDVLRGGNGNDILNGGEGKDQFWIASNYLPEGTDTVTDFQVGIDVIGFGGIGEVKSFENLSLIQNEQNTVIKVGDRDLATLTGIQADTLDSSSFAFI
ncbi:MAG: calcium-binding protein [Xenococcaceae cyanobacterium]